MVSAIIVGASMAIGANGIAGPAVPPAAAAVRRHSVVHAPTGLTVRVPKSATFVGKERFDLKGVADAEIEVFVEADAHERVTRLYWIQFEQPWSRKPGFYNYTSDQRQRQWGTTVWVNDGPNSTTSTPEPRSDTAHVRAMLAKAGYTLPPEMGFVRFIQLLDDPKGTGHGGHELMFIYAEDLARTGKTLAHWEKAPDAEWAPVGKALVARAASSFQVTRK